MFRYLPEQASEFAPTVDWINNRVTDLSVFFTVAIVGTMLYFAVKYRRKGDKDHPTPRIEGSILLEIIWTVVPTLICIVVGAYGVYGYNKLRNAPEDALEISVWGQQWAWSFEYPNGKKTSSEFTVPVGKPVKLIISSRDVLHSFFVPGMRTKVDAVPGHFTMQWFRPVVTGPQRVFCTEYCGTSHSNMMALMNVVSEAEYALWVEDKGEDMSPAETGKALYTQNACNSCHSLDGSRLVGPSFLNLYERNAEFHDGEKYVADENYIRESILYPQKKVVSGYPMPSPMPSYEGRLSDEEISKIIAFIKTLKGKAAPQPAPVEETQDASELSPVERGKRIYQQKACIGCHSLDGSKVVGPSFKGLYGRQGEGDDGSAYVADDAYIEESILYPQKVIVKGYPKPSPMPPYEGQLSDSDIADVIEFIKSNQ
jgi:cytochrome c oxidase subunit II